MVTLPNYEFQTIVAKCADIVKNIAQNIIQTGNKPCSVLKTSSIDISVSR